MEATIANEGLHTLTIDDVQMYVDKLPWRRKDNLYYIEIPFSRYIKIDTKPFQEVTGNLYGNNTLHGIAHIYLNK